MMGRRAATHRAVTRRGPVAVVSAVAVGLGLGVVAWLGVSALLAGDPQPSAPDPSPSVSQPWTWPVQTVEPSEPVVPGEGTFVDPAGVDRTDPDAVAEAAARALASHDTLTDEDYTDSEARALEFYAPELPPMGAAERATVGASWLEAQEHDGYTTPVLSPVPVPIHGPEPGRGPWLGVPTVSADGEDVLAYQYRVLLNWAGRDGWGSDPREAQVRVVKLSLAERDGQWVVVERYYADAGPGDYATK